MKDLKDLKLSTLKRKHKEIQRKIEKAHENVDYDKIDELSLQRNKIEVELEARNN